MTDTGLRAFAGGWLGELAFLIAETDGGFDVPSRNAQCGVTDERDKGGGHAALHQNAPGIRKLNFLEGEPEEFANYCEGPNAFFSRSLNCFFCSS